MNLEFFDSNLFLGRPMKCRFEPVCTARALIEKMDAIGIREGLVWHVAQHDYSPVEGNELLNRAIKGQERLLGCWTILPPQTEEVIRADFFEGMKKHRIAALRAFPDFHRFLLNRVTFGEFLDELSERRIPLLLSLGRAVSWPAIYGLLDEFPYLTCILCDLGVWSMDRYTRPLLETYPNVYLETSMISLQAGSLKEGVERFGAGRFLFGSGFPERYPEGAMLQLLHADISDADKEKIAAKNAQGLFSSVKL
jgi:predicted TIM-barrel fold metal-dependent hydrolase